MSGRPLWSRRLDRLASRAARLAGRLLGRPTEDLLAELAQTDRRAAAPVAPIRPTVAGQIRAGRRALDAGQLAEAAHHFGQAIELNPEATWAWHGRGDALQRLGDPAGALVAYTRAAELSPETGLHQGGRANALAALGRVDEAERSWAEALRLDPSLTWMRDGRETPRAQRRTTG